MKIVIKPTIIKSAILYLKITRATLFHIIINQLFKNLQNYNIDFSKQEKFEIIQFLYNYSIKLLSKLIIISCCTFGRFLILVE